MWSTWKICTISLLSMIRSPFFWIWNLAAVLITLGLSRITYFDFEGDSSSELFLSTLVLNGAANAFVFHLSAVRELARKEWDLLLTRPMSPLPLVIGRFLGLMAFQALIAFVLVGAYSLQAWSVGHSFLPQEALEWTLALSKIAALSAFFGLAALWLSGFWAVVAMVGAYLAGHLSAALDASTPAGLSAITAAASCIIPDLAPTYLAGGDPALWNERGMIFWELLYLVAYLGFILGISFLSLPTVRNRQ